MKTGSLYLALLIFVPGLPAFSQSLPAQSRVYFKPSGPVGNFTLLVPANWKKSSSITVTEESYTFSFEKSSIRVRAFFSDTDIMHLLGLKKRELAKTDPSFIPIISNEKIVIRKSIDGKLLEYEFKDHKGKNPLIQRTFITTQGSCVYIIDCRAPSAMFYKYDKDFTAAMGTFALTGNLKSNKPAPKAEIPDNTKPEKQADIQHGSVNKDAIHIDDDEISKFGLTEEDAGENKDQPQKTIPGPSEKPTDNTDSKSEPEKPDTQDGTQTR